MLSFDATVRLGWAFVRVMARNLVHRAPQLARFVQQYEPDGILLFAPADREVLSGASRCIGCARCDNEALVLGEFTALGPRGPMAFVVGVSRHSGEHDTAQLAPEISAETLARLSAVCPVTVPFAPLVALVRRRGETLARVRSSPTE